MNNSIQNYNKEELEDFGVYSNYEYEMISSVSNVAKDPFDAIDIINDMVKTGKIDPWNVDVVKVYDEYMKKLKELNENKNLKFLGRAFVFAAGLLNLKSKVLNGISLEDFIPQEEDYDDIDYDGFDADFEPEQLQLPSSNVISFDEVLQRRTSTKLNRSRGVRLEELTRYLELYEQLERKRELKQKLEKDRKRFRSYSKISAKTISDMAQDEYIKALVDKMEQNLNKILEREEKIEINELTLLGFSRYSAYIALLNLESNGKFTIEQKDFYGELFVKRREEDVPEIKAAGE